VALVTERKNLQLAENLIADLPCRPEVRRLTVAECPLQQDWVALHLQHQQIPLSVTVNWTAAERACSDHQSRTAKPAMPMSLNKNTLCAQLALHCCCVYSGRPVS